MATLVPELYCTDLDRSLRFYVELLGFKVSYARPEDRFALLDRNGAQIMIGQPTTRTWLTGELTRPFGRGVNFEIDTSDAEELYVRCEASGSPIFLPLEEKWYRRGDVQLGCRQFIVQDPDGYLLRFSKSIGSRPGTPPHLSTHVQLPNRHRAPLPVEFAQDDVRLAESFIEFALDRFSVPGDRLLDPFAGFGTVLTVAERMGREAWGIELDPRRTEYGRTLLRSPHRLLTGDSRGLKSMSLPIFDLALVSPPYMCRGDAEDPLASYATAGRGYESYLDDLLDVFNCIGDQVKPGGRVIVEVSNLKRQGRVTTLAWDIGLRLADRFQFDGEIVVAWDSYGYGYDHSYCLVYTNQ